MVAELLGGLGPFPRTGSALCASNHLNARQRQSQSAPARVPELTRNGCGGILIVSQVTPAELRFAGCHFRRDEEEAVQDAIEKGIPPAAAVE